jgi:hypothetical protein
VKKIASRTPKWSQKHFYIKTEVPEKIYVKTSRGRGNFLKNVKKFHAKKSAKRIEWKYNKKFKKILSTKKNGNSNQLYF